jgi:hypothetical protein
MLADGMPAMPTGDLICGTKVTHVLHHEHEVVRLGIVGREVDVGFHPAGECSDTRPSGGHIGDHCAEANQNVASAHPDRSSARRRTA